MQKRTAHLTLHSEELGRWSSAPNAGVVADAEVAAGIGAHLDDDADNLMPGHSTPVTSHHNDDHNAMLKATFVPELRSCHAGCLRHQNVVWESASGRTLHTRKMASCAVQLPHPGTMG